MFDACIEELSLARVADYERLVRRLLREREALAAAAMSGPVPEATRRRLPRPFAWRRSSAAR